MIDLTIDTDDERRQELCSRYWKLNESGSDFAEPMDRLKEEFGLPRGAILGVIRSESTAVSTIHKCECGRRKELHSRKDFRSTPKQTPYECQQCKEEAATAEEGNENGRAETSSKTPSEEKPLQDLLAAVGSESDDALSSFRNGKKNGREEDLRPALRQLARVLARASQRLERLSHQINGS